MFRETKSLAINFLLLCIWHHVDVEERIRDKRSMLISKKSKELSCVQWCYAILSPLRPYNLDFLYE